MARGSAAGAVRFTFVRFFHRRRMTRVCFHHLNDPCTSRPGGNNAVVAQQMFLGPSAAHDLVGKQLPGGWTVVSRVAKDPVATGGNFSINYWVRNSAGDDGFCKVLNLHWILQAGDPIVAMREATETYEFERDVARICAGLSKVITAIDDGMVRMPGYQIELVCYIIFETAEGDVRHFLNVSPDASVVVRLRILHQLAVGLRQLHGVGIAHQDVKPSNTLIFAPDPFGNNVAKAGDLGRATMKGRPMAHDNYAIAGDPQYAPIEALYSDVPASFGARRMGCDLYQLGSMLTFVFTGFTMNALLMTELHPQFHPQNWSGTFEDVLPYVRDAFDRALVTVRSGAPAGVDDELSLLVAQLCEPNPYERGHRKGFNHSVTNQYSLTRFVTDLDLLARQAQLRLGL